MSKPTEQHLAHSEGSIDISYFYYIRRGVRRPDSGGMANKGDDNRKAGTEF